MKSLSLRELKWPFQSHTAGNCSPELERWLFNVQAWVGIRCFPRVALTSRCYTSFPASLDQWVKFTMRTADVSFICTNSNAWSSLGWVKGMMLQERDCECAGIPACHYPQKMPAQGCQLLPFLGSAPTCLSQCRQIAVLRLIPELSQCKCFVQHAP